MSRVNSFLLKIDKYYTFLIISLVSDDKYDQFQKANCSLEKDIF